MVGSLEAGIRFSSRNTCMLEFPGKCTKAWSTLDVYITCLHSGSYKYDRVE